MKSSLNLFSSFNLFLAEILQLILLMIMMKKLLFQFFVYDFSLEKEELGDLNLYLKNEAQICI